MAFWDKCLIMNWPKDFHSSASVYTAYNKETVSSIVLEFAIASTTDSPLHSQRQNAGFIVSLLANPCRPEGAIIVKVPDVTAVKDTILLSDEEFCNL